MHRNYTYAAFGKLAGRSGGTENNYQFVGEQLDEHLGEYYLRDRFYDQNSGRFLRRDVYEGNTLKPITLNKYLYGNSNPLTFTDPSGFFSIFETNAASSIANTLNNIQLSSSSYLINAADSVAQDGDYSSEAFFANLALEAFSEFFPGLALVGAVVPVAIYAIRVPFGQDDLSQEVINYRRSNNISEYRNVAVVEYRDADGSLKTVTRQNELRGLHAEMVALNEVLITRGVDPRNVTRLYTELAPCDNPGRYCQRQLARLIPNANVSFSFSYGPGQLRRQGIDEKISLFKKIGLNLYRRPR